MQTDINTIALGIIAGAIAGGLIEYILDKILPDPPTIKHIVAILMFIVVAVYVAAWATQTELSIIDVISSIDLFSSSELPCKYNVGEIGMDTDVIAVHQETRVWAQVDNPQNRSLVYDWQAIIGAMNPGRYSSSSQSLYLASSVTGNDIISLTVSAPGCTPVTVVREISVVEASCSPGGKIFDPMNDVFQGYLDVVSMETSVQGDLLEVVVHVRDLPRELRFHRPGMSDSEVEYAWAVYVDVDNSDLSGMSASDVPASHPGADYIMEISPDIMVSEEIFSNELRDVSTMMKAKVCELKPLGSPGSYVYYLCQNVAFELNPDENTLVLRGNIPGININSQITFNSYGAVGGDQQPIKDFLNCVP